METSTSGNVGKGSSNGIGRETAILFSSEGAKVTITGRNSQALEETKRLMIRAGACEDGILDIRGDLRDDAVKADLVQATVKKFGGIDILVNNAGGGAIDNSNEQGFEQGMDNYDYILDLNLRSVVVLCKLALPHLIERQGEIVMCPALPYYSMSKGALDQLMRAMAVEYISKGVRVNSVNPGLITTTFMQKQGATLERQLEVREEFLTSDSKRVPARRAGTSMEIAQAIAFLADRSMSSYVVGHTLVVDGGCSIVNPLLAHYSLDYKMSNRS
ncbi:oxidoreductase, short chain dehydrogenase/reductase family protein [Ancylostoma ceylanicum]|uniref:Oxidoreductase, short chain dehydrogenase/reductase family protein n=1 Tax=Ancylostoma ceylanicum TaxID=53326 RepID=A0A0D6M6H5_9BILA|nr:oxidoreductase, short chain dehydrogenase/reductase family protein [Ancylostoma ceylanicum]